MSKSEAAPKPPKDEWKVSVCLCGSYNQLRNGLCFKCEMAQWDKELANAGR